MPPEDSRKLKRPIGADRPFPWRCNVCATVAVELSTIRYDAEVRQDGRLHEFVVPSLEIPICKRCGEKVFTEDVDQQINMALRRHLRLLTPDEMRDAIQRIGMSQKELAENLGIAEETLSRWLNELQIQSRAMDNLLRVFFALPAVRTALCGEMQNPGLGTSDQLSAN